MEKRLGKMLKRFLSIYITYSILKTIRDNGTCTRSDLIDRVEMSRQVVDSHIRILKGKGLIKDFVCKEDERKKHYGLTGKGFSLYQRLKRFDREFEEVFRRVKRVVDEVDEHVA